jgi:hypothetical protein
MGNTVLKYYAAIIRAYKVVVWVSLGVLGFSVCLSVVLKVLGAGVLVRHSAAVQTQRQKCTI